MGTACTGNRNLYNHHYKLFYFLSRSASVLCVGHENIYQELRARTCCELAMNKGFYLTPDKLNALQTEPGTVYGASRSRQLGKNVVVASSNNFYKGAEIDGGSIAETVFELDCMETPVTGTYSTMWHVHALSSVLKLTIHSVYPNVNCRIRTAFHKVVAPREECSSNIFKHDFIIMWTSTSKASGTIWSPNRFVPCIRYTNSFQVTTAQAEKKQTKALNSNSDKISIKKVALVQNTQTPVSKCIASVCAGQPSVKQFFPTMQVANESLGQKNKTQPKCDTSNSAMCKTLCIPSIQAIAAHKSAAFTTTCKHQTLTAPLLSSTNNSLINFTTKLMPINALSTDSDFACDIHDHPLEQNVEIGAGKKIVEVEDYFQCNEADEYDVESKQSSEMEQDLEMEAKTMEVDEDCLHDEADEYVKYDVETEQSSNMNDGDTEIEHNSSISSVMTCAEKDTEKLEFCENDKILPFPLLLVSWYFKQGKLFFANRARSTLHQQAAVVQDGAQLISVRRSKVTGSIEDNLSNLEHKINLVKSVKKSGYMMKCLDVGKYILEHGPLVATQEAVKVYNEHELEHVRIDSSELYDILSKHLKVVQIYICGKAYLAADCNPNLEQFISQITAAVNKSQMVNETIERLLGHIYKESLDYLDTPRDKQVLKGVLSILTSISFASHLGGKLSRHSVRTAFKMLPMNLSSYKQIKHTSLMVRNDLTTLQQHLLYKRLVKSRKLREIRIIGEGRGRLMKSSQFPQLAQVLEYAFGDYTSHVFSGGGLESHPRLTDGTLYRAADNTTTMKEARKLLMALSPSGFCISLSSCYNYTMNYRKGTAQALRHHDGKDVNANVCLHLPTRTDVEQLVINIHWSTCNVNSIIDFASFKKEQSVVISKDSKSIVCGGIAPVQRPGRTWKRRTLPFIHGTKVGSMPLHLCLSCSWKQ